jgi:hypothetical protein
MSKQTNLKLKQLQKYTNMHRFSLSFFFNLLSIRFEETVTNFEDDKPAVIIPYS